MLSVTPDTDEMTWDMVESEIESLLAGEENMILPPLANSMPAAGQPEKDKAKGKEEDKEQVKNEANTEVEEECKDGRKEQADDEAEENQAEEAA